MEANKDLLVKVWAFEMRYPAAGELHFGNDIIAAFPSPCNYETYIRHTKYIAKYGNSSSKMDNDWLEIDYQYPNTIPDVNDYSICSSLALQLKYELVYRQIGRTDNPQSGEGSVR